MKFTLLELTQQLLSAMDSDEVNSVSDTVESMQVATLLRGVYYDMAVELDLPEHKTLFQLIASGDNDLPALMTVPENVTNLDWVRYDYKLSTDTREKYKELEYVPLEQFMDRMTSLSDDSDKVGVMLVPVNGETFEIKHRNDLMPSCYTSVDDYTIIFDAYDSDEENTLQKSNSMCHGSTYSQFDIVDTFTPDLDPTQFSYYINRAKVRAFAELKETANQEATSETRNQKITLRKRNRRVEIESEFDRAPKYGRK